MAENDLAENRSAHYYSSNLILGSSDNWYHWTASGNEIVTYNTDALFAREADRRNYSFIADDLLLISSLASEQIVRTAHSDRVVGLPGD